jgi:hypothetical protein
LGEVLGVLMFASTLRTFAVNTFFP